MQLPQHLRQAVSCRLQPGPELEKLAFGPSVDAETPDRAASELGAGNTPGLSPASPAGLALLDEEPGVREDTSATLPSVKSAQQSVDDYFDGTRSISVSMDDVNAAIDEDTDTGEQSISDTGRQRSAASSVLHASRPRPSSVPWTALTVVPLIVLALIAGGGYWYWDTLIGIAGPGNTLAPRKVARVGALPNVPAPTAAVASTPSVTTSAIVESQAVARAQARAAEAEARADAMAREAELSRQREQQAQAEIAQARADQAAREAADARAEAAAAQANVDTLAPKPAAASSGEFVAAAPPVEAVLKPEASAQANSTAAADPLGTPNPEVVQRVMAGLSESGFTSSGAIKITRRSLPARVHPLISSGYDALQAGDLGQAEKSYRRILQTEARNRDALLGLAAVAMRGRDWPRAQSIYLELLSLNPRDSLAQAALVSLQSNVDPTQSEALFKRLLRREPDGAYLHFSLGNVFAGQGRWPEAQQAFFDAYRLDLENPDYALTSR